MDVFTTVYTVSTNTGTVLFDCGSYGEDVENYILPFLEMNHITSDMLKYVFISHNHGDHSGGLREFMKHFPKACIVTRCLELKESFKDFSVLMPEDGEVLLNELKAVTVPGHTSDCTALFDTRTKTLISGDALQSYGLFGSGKWASNVTLVREHLKAIEKLRNADIEQICTAHDYHPYGYRFDGKDAVRSCLQACTDALYQIKDIINENPDADDEEVCKIHDSLGLPSLAADVVTAVRREL